MLWPGRNRLSASGTLTESSRLRVTYRWDDLVGKGRENSTEIGTLPGSWQIDTHGQRWEEVRCRSLVLEVVPTSMALDTANPAGEVSPKGPETRPVPLPYPTERSIGGKARKLPTLAKAIRDIEQALDQKNRNTADVLADRLLVLAVYGDPATAPLLERVIREDVSSHVENKIRACQALYRSIGDRSTPLMVELIRRDPHISWRSPDSKWTSDTQWLHVAATAISILRQIRDFAQRDEVADMIAQTLEGRMTRAPLAKIYRGEEIGWGLLRALGDLGNRQQVPLLRSFLEKKDDAAVLAVEALMKIGDPVVLPELLDLIQTAEYQPLMKVLITAIGRLGTERNGQRLYPFLRHWDEDIREAAAQALLTLGDRNALGLLVEVAETEPFPWVRKSMRTSIAGLAFNLQ